MRAVLVPTDILFIWININTVGKLCLRHKTSNIQPQCAVEVKLQTAIRMGF